jgi:MFS family permease
LEQHKHPLAYREFFFFWIARLCTTLGQNCMVVVIGWQVYDIARETMSLPDAALQLGFIGLVQFAPLFVLTPVTGWVADRFDRGMIGRACIVTQLLCAVALGWLTHAGSISLAPLFGVAALLGVARAFWAPSQNALGPNLVPREVWPRAIATTSIAGRVGAILGPAAGGFLYAVGPGVPYDASGALYAVSFVCMFLIRPIVIPPMDATQSRWRQMMDGLHYVFQNKIVLGAISLDLFAVLLGGATAMLPIYARDILHVGPSGLGALRAAPAIGALLSAAWFSYRPLRQNIGVKMFIAVGVFGLATVVFGLSRSMPLSLACLAILGAADMLSVYVRQTLIQISTPDEKRGRVGAVAILFISASNELGEAESGFLAFLIGPVAAVVSGGVGAIFVAMLWAYWFPSLRKAGSLDGEPGGERRAA